MKHVVTLFILALALMGCRPVDERYRAEARHMITENQAECVLLTADYGEMIPERGRGVAPLLHLYDAHKEKMPQGSIVDKVIGRAAAFIAINGKVRYVHGELMSEDAVALLQKHNIETSYTKLVPRILNRKLDGLCPLEQAVEGIDDPTQALDAIRLKLEALKQAQGN